MLVYLDEEFLNFRSAKFHLPTLLFLAILYRLTVAPWIILALNAETCLLQKLAFFQGTAFFWFLRWNRQKKMLSFPLVLVVIGNVSVLIAGCRMLELQPVPACDSDCLSPKQWLTLSFSDKHPWIFLLLIFQVEILYSYESVFLCLFNFRAFSFWMWFTFLIVNLSCHKGTERLQSPCCL